LNQGNTFWDTFLKLFSEDPPLLDVDDQGSLAPFRMVEVHVVGVCTVCGFLGVDDREGSPSRDVLAVAAKEAAEFGVKEGIVEVRHDDVTGDGVGIRHSFLLLGDSGDLPLLYEEGLACGRISDLHTMGSGTVTTGRLHPGPINNEVSAERICEAQPEVLGCELRFPSGIVRDIPSGLTVFGQLAIPLLALLTGGPPPGRRLVDDESDQITLSEVLHVSFLL